jgi:hypothetical protein
MTKLMFKVNADIFDSTLLKIDAFIRVVDKIYQKVYYMERSRLKSQFHKNVPVIFLLSPLQTSL